MQLAPKGLQIRSQPCPCHQGARSLGETGREEREYTNNHSTRENTLKSPSVPEVQK